jgi:septum formation protein
MRLVLASGSPRRRELLALLGLAFDVVPADVDESARPDELPIDLVRRLALDKVEAVAAIEANAGAEVIVLAADTIVEVAGEIPGEIPGEILGKPADAGDARRMLRRLSARTHRVHTGVAVRRHDATLSEVVTTEVTMIAMSDAAIEWYLATGEPMDKAGAYAIQELASLFVTAIEGNHSNVVGLPVPMVYRMLAARDVRPGSDPQPGRRS